MCPLICSLTSRFQKFSGVFHDAGLHLGGGLFSEGDCQNAFRGIARGDQGNEALAELIGLARPGGRGHYKAFEGVLGLIV